MHKVGKRHVSYVDGAPTVCTVDDAPTGTVQYCKYRRFDTVLYCTVRYIVRYRTLYLYLYCTIYSEICRKDLLVISSSSDLCSVIRSSVYSTVR